MAKNKWLFLAETAYDIFEDTNLKLFWELWPRFGISRFMYFDLETNIVLYT